MTSRWRPYVTKRLGELEAGDGQDTWEGTWPSAATIAVARNMMKDLLPEQSPTPSVVPGADGEVCFIWHKGGWTIELEFLSGTQTMVLMYQHQEKLEDIVHGPLYEHRGVLRSRLLELSK